MWVRCVAVVVLVAGVCWRGATGKQLENDPVGCGPALTFLVERGVAEKTHLARLPGGDAGEGEGSEVCGGGACCLPEMTEALLEEGKRSLGQVVSDTADNLLGGLMAQRQAFNSAVESALSSSERRAVRVIETRYPRVAAAAQPVLRQLYAGLRAGLTQADERPLKRSLAAFWDDLFPPVYHSVLHTLPLPFTDRYSQCLREARRVVRPWGPIPTLVGEPLLRGMHSARLLLHALDVGSHVLQAARSLPIGRECSEAAARMELCGACHGSLLPPCPGLCLNVARGCLAPLAEVDGAWADLAGAVTRVQESLQVVRLAHLLHQLPDKVSEAIMLAMEHGPRLLKKVRKNCSSPMYVEETGEEARTNHAALPAELTEAERLQEENEENLEEELEKEERASRRVLDSVAGAVGAVETTKYWWAGLPETHCRNITAHDSTCWNGIREGQYTKTTAGVGISVQKYNPEVRLDRPDTSVYSLADKLRSVRRLVMTTLTWLPKSDSRRSHNYAQTDGSGSGVDVLPGMEMAVESHSRGGSPSDDDEEYYPYPSYEDYEGSGRNDGSGDYSYISEPEVKETPAPKTEPASSGRPGSSLLLVMLVTVAGAALQRQG